MSSTEEFSSQNPGETKGLPLVTSLQDLTIVESIDRDGKLKKTAFYHITSDYKVFYAETPKHKRETTIAEVNSILHRVKDEQLYPPIPSQVNITLPPFTLDDSAAYVKQTGFNWYEEGNGEGVGYNIPKALLDETLIMERLSKIPHPHIVHYYGCRVARGYITAILLERLDKTLMQYISTPEFEALDKTRFCEALEDAVEYIHALGLAHNDINPHNIMVRDGMPVLIDFDSCQPVGMRLQSLGSEGWYEEFFTTSAQSHDVYALRKIREWIQNPS